MNILRIAQRERKSSNAGDSIAARPYVLGDFVVAFYFNAGIELAGQKQRPTVSLMASVGGEYYEEGHSEDKPRTRPAAAPSKRQEEPAPVRVTTYWRVFFRKLEKDKVRRGKLVQNQRTHR
eukprot:scaffold40_cov305-Pinguiococcus_pyrenoidosus.AAC.3